VGNVHTTETASCTLLGFNLNAWKSSLKKYIGVSQSYFSKTVIDKVIILTITADAEVKLIPGTFTAIELVLKHAGVTVTTSFLIDSHWRLSIATGSVRSSTLVAIN
jgi:hypothetical protein